MALLTPAILTNFRSLADKSLKIEIVTQELDPDLIARVSELHQQYVNVYITKGEIDSEATQILDQEKVDKSQVKAAKTSSQRLRAILWILWSQTNEGETFEEFYAQKMDLLTEQIRERLD